MNAALFLNKLLAASFMLAGSVAFAQTDTPRPELAASCSQANVATRVDITGTVASLAQSEQEYILSWKNSARGGYYYTQLSTGQGYKIVPKMVNDEVKTVTVYFVSLSRGDILVKTLPCTTTTVTVAADSGMDDIHSTCGKGENMEIMASFNGTDASLLLGHDGHSLFWEMTPHGGQYVATLAETGEIYKIVPTISGGRVVKAVIYHRASSASQEVLLYVLTSCFDS